MTDVFEYRVKSFEDIGYDWELASHLAESKDSEGVYVYHGDVRRLIDLMVKKGKSIEEARHVAFGIFSDV